MRGRSVLETIATSLERVANAAQTLAGSAPDVVFELTDAAAYHWENAGKALRPIAEVNRVPLSLLYGIDDVSQTLMENSLQFSKGHAANNALLWGAKGMGKSSLVKAVHAEILSQSITDAKRLILIEINREDISSLPILLRAIAQLDAQFIIFCDDLSFDQNEASYKSLKSILDGGLEGRPTNAIFYATSNRRHLMPRDMIDNERSSAINPNEAVDEKVSLSDRFGLWLGFHNCSQDTYLRMIEGYAAHYGIELQPEALRAQAIEWAAIRGGRSGRVAMQFIRQVAGKQGLSL